MEEITKTVTIEEEEEESEYFRYEVDGDLIEASYFEAEIIENDDNRLRIWGGADEAKEDYPQFLISLNEPGVTGFTAGVNFTNRDESIPEDTLSFTGAAETRYSSTYTPDEEEYDGMFFFIEEIDRGEDGYIQGDFSGSITTEDHQEEISISNGELRVKF